MISEATSEQPVLRKIDVIYQDVPNERRIFEFDVDGLSRIESDVFRTNGEIKIVIKGGEKLCLGEYAPRSRTVFIYNESLLRNIRYLCNDVLWDLSGQNRPNVPIINVATHKVRSLPHILSGGMEKTRDDFWQGNAARRKKYLKSARTNDNQYRAEEFMSGLASVAHRNLVAKTLTHELGHDKYRNVMDALSLTNLTLGYSIGVLLAGFSWSITHNTGIFLSSLLTCPLVGGGVSFLLSDTLNERMAYDSEKKYFRDVMSCIKINPRIFKKLVVNNKP